MSHFPSFNSSYLSLKIVMGTGAVIIITVLIAHFAIGIGYLIYKLNKKD